DRGEDFRRLLHAAKIKEDGATRASELERLRGVLVEAVRDRIVRVGRADGHGRSRIPTDLVGPLLIDDVGPGRHYSILKASLMFVRAWSSLLSIAVISSGRSLPLNVSTRSPSLITPLI